MKHRLFNKFYAKLTGHFWLPCPLCAQYFGGHEWDIRSTSKSQSIIINYAMGLRKGICPDCRDADKGDSYG